MQVLRMAAYRLFIEALPVDKQFEVRTQDGLDNIHGLRIKGGAEEGGARVVVDAQHHDLLIARIVGRGGQEERAVGRDPALRNFLCLVQQGQRFGGSGFDVAAEFRNVVLHQAAHDQAALLLENRRRARYVQRVGKDFDVLNAHVGERLSRNSHLSSS